MSATSGLSDLLAISNLPKFEPAPHPPIRPAPFLQESHYSHKLLAKDNEGALDNKSGVQSTTSAETRQRNAKRNPLRFSQKSPSMARPLEGVCLSCRSEPENRRPKDSEKTQPHPAMPQKVNLTLITKTVWFLSVIRLARLPGITDRLDHSAVCRRVTCACAVSWCRNDSVRTTHSTNVGGSPRSWF